MGPRKTERKKGGLPCPITSAVQTNSDENSGKLEGCFCGMQMYMM